MSFGRDQLNRPSSPNNHNSLSHNSLFLLLIEIRSSRRVLLIHRSQSSIFLLQWW